MSWTVFNYMYRDAGNNKAYGSMLLDGDLNTAQKDTIKNQFFSNDLFIAEQIGIPTLYEQLFQWSAGENEEDHCWHEFVSFNPQDSIKLLSDTPIWGKAPAFFETINEISLWDEELSPNFYIGNPMHAALSSAKRSVEDKLSMPHR